MVERKWAESRPVAAAVKVMGPGCRQTQLVDLDSSLLMSENNLMVKHLLSICEAKL
jgi:hypothetical protein